MTLRIIEPFMVGASNVTASNVALEDAWAAGTYTLGQQARVGEIIYEVSAATTTEEPSEAAVDWFNAGPANRYAAFDLQFGADQYRVIETKTINADSITFTLNSLPRLSSIAFFGAQAENIKVVATDVTPGDIVNIDYDMPNAVAYNGSFWRWSFLPSSFVTKYVNFQISVPKNTPLEITITNDGGEAQVGVIAMGVADVFGIVAPQTSRSLRSRSVRKTEGTLTSLLRRTPSARVAYSLTLLDYQADQFWRAIDNLDGVAAVFAGPDENPEFTVYGVVGSCQTVSDVNGVSKVQLEVETL